MFGSGTVSTPLVQIGVTLGLTAIAIAVFWWFCPVVGKKGGKGRTWLWYFELTLMILEAWCLCTIALIDFDASAFDNLVATAPPPSKLR